MFLLYRHFRAISTVNCHIFTIVIWVCVRSLMKTHHTSQAYYDSLTPQLGLEFSDNNSAGGRSGIKITRTQPRRGALVFSSSLLPFVDCFFDVCILITPCE